MKELQFGDLLFEAGGIPSNIVIARLTLCTFFLFLFTPIAAAQNGTVVSGHISDDRGASVQGAEVSLRSRNGVQSTTRTGADGAFSFRDIVNGDYILEAKAEGFASATTETFHINRGQQISRDLTLPVAGITENVVVTATGTPQTTDEVAKAVTSISAEDLEARKEITVAEALRGTPGLRVQQQGSPGSLVTLRVRGLRNYDTSVLLDGLRVRDASDINGSAAPLLADFLPSDLDRVEILRGSGSSIYGTNAIGGVINLVPRTGSGSPRFEMGFEGGGLGLFRARVSGSGGLGDRAGYSFNVTRLDFRRGIDGADQYGNTTAGGRFEFNATPSITIAGNFLGSFANARVNDSPFALSGAFSSKERFPPAVEGQTFHADFNNPDEGRRTNLLVASVRFSQRLNDVATYTVAYQHVATRRRNYNGPEIDPAFASLYPFDDFAFNSTNDGSTDTLDVRGILRIGRYNLLTGGFEFERESFFQEFLPAFSAVNGTTDRQRTYAAFGQHQLVLLDGRLQASIAVRAQAYRIRPADRPGFLSGVNAENSIVGDGAVSYLVRSTGTKLRIHAGNGLRAPSLFERFGEGTFSGIGFVRFGDPTIRAEQSVSVDAGVDQRFFKDRARAGVTYFYTRLQRVITFTGFMTDPLGVGRFSGYGNGPGGLARGIETYAEVSPLRGMDVATSYTFTNSDRNTEAEGLQPEFVVPRHLFGVSVRQRYHSFSFSADVNYTGSYIAPVFENGFPFRTANLRFGGYTKVDAYAAYDRTVKEHPQMTLFAGADNFFNHRYFENGFRSPGIVGRAGVRFRF